MKHEVSMGRRRIDARLTSEQLQKLRGVIAARGQLGAARHLGCGRTTVIKLDEGGTATREAVARVARALESLT